MNVLTADETLPDRLRSVVEPTEIRDESGEVLGHYTPAPPQGEQALYEKAKSLFDPAETARIAEAERGQGLPLDEALRQIRSGEFPR